MHAISSTGMLLHEAPTSELHEPTTTNSSIMAMTVNGIIIMQSQNSAYTECMVHIYAPCDHEPDIMQPNFDIHTL